jgi:hypothetical protein
LVEFAGTEECNLKNVSTGDVTVTAGDTGIAEGTGTGVEVVGTGVCVAGGFSGSIHPAHATIRMRKTIRKIPEYFIVYPHLLNIKNLMIRIKRM